MNLKHKCQNFQQSIEKPCFFDTVVDIATQLSKGFPFVRCDFYITENGFVPIGIEKDVYGDTKDKLLGNCFKTGIHCGGWVIKNLNMDYLKAKNGACNSGSVNLSWSNTTCK